MLAFFSLTPRTYILIRSSVAFTSTRRRPDFLCEPLADRQTFLPLSGRLNRYESARGLRSDKISIIPTFSSRSIDRFRSFLLSLFDTGNGADEFRNGKGGRLDGR